MGFELFIARRYLRSPRKDRSISIITKVAVGGVALGVIVLIVTLSMINGMHHEQQQALRGAESDLTVYHFSSRGFQWRDDHPLINRISNIVDIEAYTPFITDQALIIGPQKSAATLIRGIDIEREPTVIPLDFYIRTDLFEVKRDNRRPGRELDQSSREKSGRILESLLPHYETTINDATGKARKVNVSGIILGSQLARNLGVQIGDSVKVMTIETRMTPMGEIPRIKVLKVVGYFETGNPGYDEFLSLVDMSVAQKVFQMNGKITGVRIKLVDHENADRYKEMLSKEIPMPYFFSTWKDSYRNILAVFQLEKLGLTIILTLIILLGSFLIVCSLIMLVVEKTKDIAILKAMGAKDSAIRKIFIFQGSVIGLLGTGIGVGLGLLTCWVIGSFDIIDIPAGVYVSNRIPMYVNPAEIIGVAIGSILICFFVTIIPSQKAVRLDPVEGMRND